MTDDNRMLPLKPQDFQLLMLLYDRPRHAYGMSMEAEATGQARLEIGSLYRIISRMITAGLIEAVDSPADAPADDRRRYYAITPLGRKAARAEAQRLEEVLEAARRKRLLPDRGAPK